MSEPKCKMDHFCNVCGRFIASDEKCGNVTDFFLEAYKQYFSQEFITDVNYAPKKVCFNCYSTVMQWKSKKKKAMPFGIPMMWSDNSPHQEENCYACINYHKTLNRRKARNKTYVGVPSVQLPLPHSEFVPVPTYRSIDLQTDISTITAAATSMDFSSEYDPGKGTSYETTKDPILVTQNQLDRIVANLCLTQKKSEELASFLKGNNLLAKGTKVTAYRKRQKELQKFFNVNDAKNFAYCNDIENLMETIGLTYKKDDWRLFIDSSLISLKVVLLHKTNRMPSVPIAYSTDTSENFDNLKDILEVVKYNEHQWRICCDLKIVSLITGLTASGRPKYPCFLCDWDSRYGEGIKGRNQYKQHNWNSRIGRKWPKDNRLHESLVPEMKILLPLLHIKLGTVKNFLKCIAKRPAVFNRLKDIFPRLSNAKIREGVVNGPDIRKLMSRQDFDQVLTDRELNAWLALKAVIKGLLGKEREENYRQSVANMLAAFDEIGVNMSYKIHLLHHHLDQLAQQLPTESDEQGERYHQTALPFEIR